MHAMFSSLSPFSDVNNMNAFIEEDPSLQDLGLWKLMLRTEGTIFNNVAQVIGRDRQIR